MEETRNWLVAHVFEGNGASLVLRKDGFFALCLKQSPKSHQDLTGLWRLSSDGVELTLYNQQDAQIRMTAGSQALHAILPQIGEAALAPTATKFIKIQIVGPFVLSGATAKIKDANSGKEFAVNAVQARPGGFATAEVEIGVGQERVGKIVKHSGKVPRFFQLPLGAQELFLESVANRYWLLPPLAGVQKAALRFAPPLCKEKTIAEGSFDIAGPGLRVEGTYVLSNSKLTLTASRASLRNLILVGARELADLLLGDLEWNLSPVGLELEGKGNLLLLPLDGAVERSAH